MASGEQARLARIKDNLVRRARIFALTRQFFQEQGFLEVETPLRFPAVAPEANIVPLLSEGWFLCTSPELHLKRLLAAGYDRLFEIIHCFRKGERGRHHNPEFTILEWYRAGGDYRRMVEDTGELINYVAQGLGLGSRIKYQGQEIDLSLPWLQITVREAFRETVGWDPVAQHDPLKFDTDLVTRVIPSFSSGGPTVLAEFPAPMASLARLKPGDPAVAERAEVFAGGLELANAYSELCDAAEQKRRFAAEAAQIEKERGQTVPLPQNFLEVLSHLPPCGGIALGMDRLVMLFCDAASIDEVLAFTSDTA
ncbi:MAG: EF-P lysine aminoacylase GenX [Dehalococcoidales bacterium]|nr:EF-P lysine aminoacylase GenX [Dehalococcoidales bacterium]